MKLRNLCLRAAAGLLGMTIGLAAGAAPMTGYLRIDGIDGESVRESTNEIERQFERLAGLMPQKSSGRHEATHTVQQRSGVAAGRSVAAEATGIADRILAETAKLEQQYRGREFREGRNHARSIAADAKRIGQYARQLGDEPSPAARAKFQERISETLRHKDRALAAHRRWLEDLAAGSSSPPRTTPAGNGDPEGAGRVRLKMPNDRSGSQDQGSRKSISVLPAGRAAPTGDPDRPLTRGTVANPETAADEQALEQGATEAE